MLSHVNTVYNPTTVDEAIELVSQQVRPLYGGVAVHRYYSPTVRGVINLANLGLDSCERDGDYLVMGSMLTLDDARQCCLDTYRDAPNASFLAELLRQEAPINLRNTMTIGDLLTERKPNSPTLTALVALNATVHHSQSDTGISTWLGNNNGDPTLITALSVPVGTATARHAYHKVSRTPADDPIVAAVACAESSTVQLALCGVADYPVAMDTGYIAEGITAVVNNMILNPPDDHWGSHEYREAMARIVARRVLEQVLDG